MLVKMRRTSREVSREKASEDGKEWVDWLREWEAAGVGWVGRAGKAKREARPAFGLAGEHGRLLDV